MNPRRFLCTTVAVCNFFGCSSAAESAALDPGFRAGTAAGVAPPARAIVDAEWSPSTRRSTSPVCSQSGPLLRLGNFASVRRPETIAVEDGQAQDGKRARVSCSLIASGAAFTFAGTASLSGSGTVALNGVVSNIGTSTVRATLQPSDSGEFTQSDCIFQPYHRGAGYEGAGFAGSMPDIAPGRVWGQLSCDLAAQSVAKAQVCAATVSFRFENCSQ